MSKPTPVYAWTFPSSSGKKTYETLRYSDGSLSCDCPGWCRRVADDGSRTCRHTRSVETGSGFMISLSQGRVGNATPPPVTSAPATEAVTPTRMKRQLS